MVRSTHWKKNNKIGGHVAGLDDEQELTDEELDIYNDPPTKSTVEPRPLPDTYPKQGVCPLCHSNKVSFGAMDMNESGATYERECQNCGANWDECYDIVFAGNWNIYDGDGNEYENLPT